MKLDRLAFLTAAILATCTKGGSSTTGDTATTEPVDTQTTPEATGDTGAAWWSDTGPTTTAPDCPGLVGARVCAGSYTTTVPVDSGGSGGGGSSQLWCPDVMLLFSPTSQVRVMDFASDCSSVDVIYEWLCLDDGTITINGEAATWDEVSGTLTTTTWGELTEAACEQP